MVGLYGLIIIQPSTGNETMMLRWFDVKDVTLFAQEIAAEYGRLRKSTALRMDDASKRKKKSGRLAQKVGEYHRANRWNFYKKARMISEIRDGVAAVGVPAAEITAFVDSLVLADLPRKAP